MITTHEQCGNIGLIKRIFERFFSRMHFILSEEFRCVKYRRKDIDCFKGKRGQTIATGERGRNS